MRHSSTTRRTLRAVLRGLAPALGAAALVAGPLTGASAGAEGAAAAQLEIEHVEADGGTLQVVVGVPEGGTADLGSVTASFGGQDVTAEATPIADAGTSSVRRSAVLVVDVSNSMAGEKWDAARAAAEVFLDEVPDDVAVGLVTFADDIDVAVEPTTDTDAVRRAVEDLALSPKTRLYDGVAAGLAAAGDEGARSLLVLSDGRDTASEESLRGLTRDVEDSGVKVDVVALANSDEDAALLQEIAAAGSGQVLSADEPEALAEVFASEAEALAQQVLVSVRAPDELAGSEGTLGLAMTVDGAVATDEAFVALPALGGPDRATKVEPVPVESGFVVPQEWMYAGLGAAAVGVLLVIVIAFGGLPERSQDAVDRNIEAYTRKGAKKLAEATRGTAPEQASMTKQAVAVAESVLEGQKGLEASLGGRLEAAGLALKPAEWLLVHAGTIVALGVFGLLLGGGQILWMLLGVLLGLAGPLLFLTIKRRRRLAAFKAQLADTLQLMAGSLSAGLSLAQSVDTVVRDGSDPMAAEFRRALAETRLGVEIEDALDGVADRMASVDFEWVVMAIRIQREVGGNLAELLNKVAETIREREYLQRQVKTLSAEGRLSVWILGGLPPGFMLYLTMANPSYVEPMYTSPLGWAMLVVMGVLLTGGVFWMKTVVKVEV